MKTIQRRMNLLYSARDGGVLKTEWGRVMSCALEQSPSLESSSERGREYSISLGLPFYVWGKLWF